MSKISAYTVAKAFCDNWIFVYDPPRSVLSDNGKPFNSKSSQRVCKILGVQNFFNTAHHPQTNGQTESFNRTTLSPLRHYVADNQQDWDQYINALTFAYNTQAHRSTNLPPYKLVLSQPPQPISLKDLQKEQEGIPAMNVKEAFLFPFVVEHPGRTADLTLARCYGGFKVCSADTRVLGMRSGSCDKKVVQIQT